MWRAFPNLLVGNYSTSFRDADGIFFIIIIVMMMMMIYYKLNESYTSLLYSVSSKLAMNESASFYSTYLLFLRAFFLFSYY